MGAKIIIREHSLRKGNQASRSAGMNAAAAEAAAKAAAEVMLYTHPAADLRLQHLVSTHDCA